MLSINNLSIQYGDKHLFRNVSVQVYKNDRIGLVGVNGAGKSTLLRVMARQIETDEGILVHAKKTTVGYLPQEIPAIAHGRTLYEEAQTAFDELLALYSELQDINRQLTSSVDHQSHDFETLLKRQGDLQHQLDQSDYFRMQAMIEKVLTGLGFKPNDMQKKCDQFSGGWLMRLMLAKLLLARPALILLDEPTNHLDLESLTWLEEFLKSYEGAMIIISHDRAFLDNTTSITWELSLGNLTVYKGNYSFYVAEKELRMQVQRAAYDNQQAKIQQTKRFVERFRAKSTKAKQAQSRLKQLEKMELIELEETESSIAFRFPPSPPSGRTAIELDGLTKQYDGRTIFHNVSFMLQRGDKMAVVGVNGAGKTTLVRILAGLIDTDCGLVRPGHNVRISYFGQHQAQELAPQYTVLQTIAHAGGDLTLTQQRSLLGAFLFRGDDVDKKVQVLSGGEKSRVALAKMIATPANLLIMDEPTNHLDMSSQEVLQQALAKFDGTIIVVSHNRYFLNSFVNKVLEIKNGTGNIYEGTIEEYLEKTGKQLKEKPTATVPPVSDYTSDKESGPAKQKSKELRQQQAMMRQEKSRKLTPLKKILADIEMEIETLETQKATLEKILADPETYKNQELFAGHSREYNEAQRRLERSYSRWEEQQQKIELIEAEFSEAEQ